MVHENKNTKISYWLLLITFLVAVMIVVGGLTRLTDSGLSITKWDLFIGIIPPLSLSNWENAFSLYKKIPEYKLLNSSMTLEQFKTIFWWEYIHRLLGRLIGLFYIVPLLYFTIKKMIFGKNLIQLYLIFLLIFLQGIIGWYMVVSGLTERTDVSHYRLSLHLTLAFIIFILLLWNYLTHLKKTNLINVKKLPFYLPEIFCFLLLLQISIGALVSGLDAGQIYQSWPLMNNSYFPDDSNINNLFSNEVMETPSLVQFLHRNLAYLLFLFYLVILFITFKNSKYKHLKKIVSLILIMMCFQIFLGILTILSGAQIYLASMHQIGAIFLVTFSVILAFKNSKIN